MVWISSALKGSTAVQLGALKHCPKHSTKPLSQVTWHDPPTHTLEEMPGPVEHTLPHPPQLLESVLVLMLQSVAPSGPHVVYPAAQLQVPVASQVPWPLQGGVVEHEGDGPEGKKHQGLLPGLGLSGDQQQF